MKLLGLTISVLLILAVISIWDFTIYQMEQASAWRKFKANQRGK